MTDIIPTPVCCNCGTDQAHMYHNAGGGRFACHECWTVDGLCPPLTQRRRTDDRDR